VRWGHGHRLFSNSVLAADRGPRLGRPAHAGSQLGFSSTSHYSRRGQLIGTTARPAGSLLTTVFGWQLGEPVSGFVPGRGRSRRGPRPPVGERGIDPFRRRFRNHSRTGHPSSVRRSNPTRGLHLRSRGGRLAGGMGLGGRRNLLWPKDLACCLTGGRFGAPRRPPFYADGNAVRPDFGPGRVRRYRRSCIVAWVSPVPCSTRSVCRLHKVHRVHKQRTGNAPIFEFSDLDVVGATAQTHRCRRVHRAAWTAPGQLMVRPADYPALRFDEERLHQLRPTTRPTRGGTLGVWW